MKNEGDEQDLSSMHSYNLNLFVFVILFFVLFFKLLNYVINNNKY